VISIALVALSSLGIATSSYGAAVAASNAKANLPPNAPPSSLRPADVPCALKLAKPTPPVCLRLRRHQRPCPRFSPWRWQASPDRWAHAAQ